MRCSTIDELSPLESAIVSTLDAISAKWKGGNGHVKKPQNVHIDNADDISKKWEGGNGYVKPTEENAAECIAAGWKK